MFAQSGRGVEVHIVGEYLDDPVIELIDFVGSKSMTRRRRYFRIDKSGKTWDVSPDMAVPLDTSTLSDEQIIFVEYYMRRYTPTPN